MNERDEKILEIVQREAPRVVQPRCPKCQHAPLEFLSNVVRTGAGHLVSILWCGHCGHTLNTQFLGIDQPQDPRIVRPA